MITLREILTEEETTADIQILLDALFSGKLFFLPRGQVKKLESKSYQVSMKNFVHSKIILSIWPILHDID